MNSKEKLNSSRARFLDAVHVRPVDRPPVWMMRQAGRSLPEYRALKKNQKFTQLVQDPTIAAEITLQPLRRFGVDAAVIFSDILVVAESLGQRYELIESKGVRLDFSLQSKSDIDRLSLHPEPISYTPKAIKLVKKMVGNDAAVIGFAGSPWTLASFMVEGGSSKENIRSRALFYDEPILFEALLEKITQATISYLHAQIDAGADIIQLFDSQGGTLASDQFWNISGQWIQRIVQALPPHIPISIFARGVHHNWKEVLRTGASIFGIDWTVNIRQIADLLPVNCAVQGNLDPALLLARPEIAVKETKKILSTMKDRNGFIFNLGHGVPPNAKVETIQAVIDTVKKS